MHSGLDSINTSADLLRGSAIVIGLLSVALNHRGQLALGFQGDMSPIC